MNILFEFQFLQEQGLGMMSTTTLLRRRKDAPIQLFHKSHPSQVTDKMLPNMKIQRELYEQKFDMASAGFLKLPHPRDLVSWSPFIWVHNTVNQSGVC